MSDSMDELIINPHNAPLVQGGIKPSGTTATNGGMWNIDAPDPRIPPAEVITQETDTHNINWGGLLVLLVMIGFLLVFAVEFFTGAIFQESICQREYKGYPLVSFQVDSGGDEVNCRYGIEATANE